MHPWFVAELERVRDMLERVRSLDDLVEADWLRLKRLGLSDADIAAACWRDRGRSALPAESVGRQARFRRVDSCAGEVEADSNYLYSTWGEADEAPPEPGRSVVILGSGPNRIGQGIEFDYCCVHAAQTFRELGYEAVMVNCNPETVSTDYDTSDRLYFEPLGVEEVLAVLEREQPVGRRDPVRRPDAAQARARDRARRLHDPRDTPFDAVDLAEDRERFAALADRLGVQCPAWGMAETADEAVAVAERIGYPVLVRPSYVLGGRAMRVCYDEEQVATRSPRSRARCSSTASSRTRSRSTSTRSATATTRTSAPSCSTSRRRASTPATRRACCPRRR